MADPACLFRRDPDILKILISTDNHLVRNTALDHCLLLVPSPCIARRAHDTLHACMAQGVWERDPVRGEDSFDAFEEVLLTATNMGADAVLLGGDLFHENKPSRSTLVKAIKARGGGGDVYSFRSVQTSDPLVWSLSLKLISLCLPLHTCSALQLISKHSLNDKPVPFEILSDQASNFVGG